MSFYQLIDGGVFHQTDGADADIFPLPEGAVAITDTEAATLQAQYLAALPKPVNATQFAQDMKAAVGGASVANTLMKEYPLVFPAIQEQTWPDVEWAIKDALSTTIVTSTQYAAIKAAAATNNIPINL